METRLIIAYSLIAALVLAGLAGALYARHNTRPRKIRRERAGEQARHDKRMEDRS